MRRALADTDFERFVHEHARLSRQAQQSGDYTTLTSAYYAVMGPFMQRAYGPHWHFFPPQHRGQSLGRAIAAGHEQLAQRLPLARGRRCLDVGSGAGGWMRYLAKRTGAHVSGVSLGREEVEIASRLHRQAGLGARCATVCADARRMPFRSDTFDGGTALYALKYFVDLESALGEIARVLKPGARFLSYNIVRTPQYDANSPRDTELVRRLEYSTGMPTLPSAAEMITAAEGSGLVCVENGELSGAAPWYHYFEANRVVPWLVDSRSSRYLVQALETLHALPRGFAHFKHEFVDITIRSLVAAGRHGIITGTNVLVFEKT